MENLESREKTEELRRALELKEREMACLCRIVSAVGSTLKVDEVLRSIVDTVTEATGCHASFIYLLDKDRQKLVLSATNDHYQKFIGILQLAPGEGVAGWSAVTLQPAMIRDRVLDDPRCKYFPELEEERFQSLLSVPIISRSNNLVGVMTMHTVAPYEFSESDLNLVTTTARLVAGAIENAQLFESTNHKLAILTTLSNLSQTISSTLDLNEVLRSLATMTVAVTESDVCLILLTDAGKERLKVGACSSPWLVEKSVQDYIPVGQSVWEEIIHSDSPRAIDLSGSALSLGQVTLLKEGRFSSVMSAPLISGSEHLGLINCYTVKPRKFSSEDFTVLATVANQTAIAIKNAQLIDMLTERNLIKDFFEELIGAAQLNDASLAARASVLGCDLSKPHVPIVIEVVGVESANSDYRFYDSGFFKALKKVMAFLEKKLIERYRNSLFHEMDRTLIGLLRTGKHHPDGSVKQSLIEVQRELQQEYGVHVAIGLGNVCVAPTEYHKGFAEAKEALHIGKAIWGSRAVIHFDDLGVYRHLYKISTLDDTRDPYQARIYKLIEHDKRRDTELLKTLETYFECLGNATQTAELLFIHRNTLCQRLARIKTVSGIDPYDTSNWLALQIAIKIVKLQGKWENTKDITAPTLLESKHMGILPTA